MGLPHVPLTRLVDPCAESTTCSPQVHVFVFTLDCNNRIYCYDTDDARNISCLADTLEIAEVSTPAVINSPVRPCFLMIYPEMPQLSLSTVLAQDHFFSDFLSLHLTNKNHKEAMRMLMQVHPKISCSATCCRFDELVGCTSV